MSSFRRTTATAIVAAVLLAGCGGGSSSSSGVSAAAYVKSVCTAVGTFRKDIQDKSSALSATTLTNPAQGKKALQDFLAAAATGGDDAVTKLKGAGSPNVTNGKSISASIVTAFNQLSAAFKQAESSANALNTSNAAAFKTGALSVYTSIRTSLTGLLKGLSGLNSSALQQAAKKEPACQTLSG
jgi:hypothetical protein